MLNKKRLVMMAVAASMVLPNNLVYLATNTPVFAETSEEAQSLTSDTFELFFEKSTVESNGNIYYKKKSVAPKNYILKSTLTLDGPILVQTDLTIDLNGFNIESTAPETAAKDKNNAANNYPYMFWVTADNSALTLNNSSTTESSLIFTKATDDNSGMIVLQSKGTKLNINKGITLKMDDSVQSECDGGWGIIVNEGAPGPNTQVTLTGTTIETPNGLTVKGTMLPDVTTLDDSQVPVITLTNVKFDTKDTGIYQAGLSNITVNNSTISSESCGIETRAGKLEVNNSTVEGGTATLGVTPEGNGQTTQNAGIAVAQHTTDKPITVNIKGSTVSGGAALAITDPQGKQVKGTDDDDITISVYNSNLKGTDYPVAYTEDTIKFTLNDTNLNGKEVTKLVDKADTDKKPGESIFISGENDKPQVEEIVEDNKPFEVNTTPRPTGGGGNKKPTKPVEPEPEEPMTPVATPTTMYRLYNNLTGEHLYTIDKNERDNLLTSDTWKDEGEGWIAPSVSDYPVYRLLNPNNGDHHYTTDKNEFDTLPSYGWVAEGVAFFSADKDNSENVLLHRLYNPNATGAGSHHYTADTKERDTLVEKGWTYEGLAWAGLPDNK